MVSMGNGLWSVFRGQCMNLFHGPDGGGIFPDFNLLGVNESKRLKRPILGPASHVSGVVLDGLHCCENQFGRVSVRPGFFDCFAD